MEEIQKYNPDEIKEWRIRLENFQALLHKKPKTVKSRKVSSQKSINYVPIDTIEKQLDQLFFGLWKWELLFEPKLIINEIMVCGRLHYFHPVANVWLHKDGVGVAQVRMKADSDWTQAINKIQNALEMDIPHAEADALKSAAAKIGDVFGRNLRRDIQEPYQALIKNSTETISKEDDDIFMKLLIDIDGFEKAEELKASAPKILAKASSLPKSLQDKLAKEIQQKYNKLKSKR